MKENKTIIKQKPKTIIVATIAVVLFMLSYLLISTSLNIKTIKEETVLNYNTTSLADYKVKLKENNYFSDKTLTSGGQYITSIIDNIELYYNYNYSSTDQINGDYTYKIVANVNADYKIDTSESGIDVRSVVFSINLFSL